VHDSVADGHCVLHMHHGKSLDACILLLNHASINFAEGHFLLILMRYR